MPKTKNQQRDETRYNVHCMSCDAVWAPSLRSPLWWRAKQRVGKGYLDALHVMGDECGCVEPRRTDNSPFRVFGYDDECQDFEAGFDSFVPAVRAYLAASRSGCVVFIDGISENVRQSLSLL